MTMQATIVPANRSKPRSMRTALAFGLLCACTASSEEVRPPQTELFFPTGAAVAPDESVLFVANANSELRYDSGAISVFKLADIQGVITAWSERGETPACRGSEGQFCCGQDPDHTETLQCPEEFFLEATSQSGVRIGNFATDIALQDFGNGALRLIVPTRGDPSIAWIDWSASAEQLTCSANGAPYALCDETHRLSFVLNDADLPSIPEEPFGVFASTAPGDEYAIVTHLTTGGVTLIDSPPPGVDRGAGPGNAQITDTLSGLFQPDANGFRGATGVAGRTPGQAGNIIYVGSRTEDRIQTFTVGRPVGIPEGQQGAAPFLLTSNWFFLDSVGGNNGGSVDTRGIAFGQGGDRMYLVNRRPPSLQLYDTSLGETGFPRNEPTGAVDICRQASTLAVADSGDGERVYVTCFQDGQIYVVDPRGNGQADDIVTVGRGPYAAAAAAGSLKKLFVTNFLEDTIAVIDIAPGSPMRNRVVLRIGEPRLP